jgi:predicted  nucleic acid-binding Zn-ribbon protein
VAELKFDCDEKEKSFRIMENDFIDNWTEVQKMRKEKNKLEALNAKKDRRIVSLEAELERVKEEHEGKTTKLMQASVEVVVKLGSSQVKIDDMKDEINHVRGINKNYRILIANCHTLGNRCHKLIMSF